MHWRGRLRRGRICLGGLRHRLAREKGMRQQDTGAADKAAVSDVEVGPNVRVVVTMQEIADAAEDDAVVKVAERTAEDQAQGEAEEAVVGDRGTSAPENDK